MLNPKLRTIQPFLFTPRVLTRLGTSCWCVLTSPKKNPRSPTRLCIDSPVLPIKSQVRECNSGDILPRTNPTSYQDDHPEEVTVRYLQILPVSNVDDWTPSGFLPNQTIQLFHARSFMFVIRGYAIDSGIDLSITVINS